MMRIRFSRRKIVIISIIAIVVAGGVAAYLLTKGDDENVPDSPPQKFYSQLTGEEISSEDANRPILGVMIENSEAARPQTGLDNAGIVFEAVTEGGITRYLAMYQEDQPEIVGPVRSVRAHFVDWVMGFDASIAHVGGSADALALIEERNAKTLNQFTYSEPYYRDESREAPHNMYARTTGLRGLQAELEHAKSTITDFPRSDDTPTVESVIDSVSIDFSGPAFKVEFRYDSTTNEYVRYLAGVPHIDTVTNKPITVKNLVVIKAKGLPNGVESIGSGQALIFKDGAVKKAKWEQTDYNTRIKLYDDQNVELSLNRGHTWFAVIASDRPVIY